MNDFYSYLKGEKANSATAMDAKVKEGEINEETVAGPNGEVTVVSAEARDDKVGCELCPNEKVGKAGECKFEKGAEPEPGTVKDVAPIVGAAIGAAVSGAAEGDGNLMSAANGDKKPKCCVKDALAKMLEGEEEDEEKKKDGEEK